MSGNEVTSASLTQLEDVIKRRIDRRTDGQIQSLTVSVIGSRIVVNGVASCFYHKQLALRGTLDAIGTTHRFQIELDVDVVTRLPSEEDFY